MTRDGLGLKLRVKLFSPDWWHGLSSVQFHCDQDIAKRARQEVHVASSQAGWTSNLLPETKWKNSVTKQRQII